MTTYLNIGPGRSGTTSFYKMCYSHHNINTGIYKEPGLIFPTNSFYIRNWGEYNDSDILLDATPNLPQIVSPIGFKRQFLTQYFKQWKYICLVRNPIKYYSSRLYINYLFHLKEKNNVKETTNFFNDHLKDLIDPTDAINFVDSLICNSHAKTYSHLNQLNDARKIFDKKDIFIIPIEYFNVYKKDMFDFLDLDSETNLFYPHINSSGLESLLKFKLKYLHIIKLIIEKIKNSKLNDLLFDCLKEIDREYETILYDHYSEYK